MHISSWTRSLRTKACLITSPAPPLITSPAPPPRYITCSTPSLHHLLHPLITSPAPPPRNITCPTPTMSINLQAFPISSNVSSRLASGHCSRVMDCEIGNGAKMQARTRTHSSPSLLARRKMCCISLEHCRCAGREWGGGSGEEES